MYSSSKTVGFGSSNKNKKSRKTLKDLRTDKAIGSPRNNTYTPQSA